MRIFVRLMQSVCQSSPSSSPRLVLSFIIDDSLPHRNPVVRQESLNILIVGLLSCLSSHSSADLDCPALSGAISRSLVDSKRVVRQAALEAVAVLSRVMGPARKAELMAAISRAERGPERGLVAAVEARLAPGRALPTLDEAGLVEYAVGATRGPGGAETSPDVEWVLAGSAAGGSSAQSAR